MPLVMPRLLRSFQMRLFRLEPLVDEQGLTAAHRMGADHRSRRRALRRGAGPARARPVRHDHLPLRRPKRRGHPAERRALPERQPADPAQGRRAADDAGPGSRACRTGRQARACGRHTAAVHAATRACRALARTAPPPLFQCRSWDDRDYLGDTAEPPATCVPVQAMGIDGTSASAAGASCECVGMPVPRCRPTSCARCDQIIDRRLFAQVAGSLQRRYRRSCGKRCTLLPTTHRSISTPCSRLAAMSLTRALNRLVFKPPHRPRSLLTTT